MTTDHFHAAQWTDYVDGLRRSRYFEMCVCVWGGGRSGVVGEAGLAGRGRQFSLPRKKFASSEMPFCYLLSLIMHARGLSNYCCVVAARSVRKGQKERTRRDCQK